MRVTRLKILYSARSPDDYLALDEHPDSYRELGVDAETFAIARTAQREFAREDVTVFPCRTCS